MLRRILISLACVLAITSVAATPAFAQYDPNFITVTPPVVPVEGTITVTAGYFKPGSQVEIIIQTPNGPVSLGILTADPNGVVSGNFKLPPSVLTGPHDVSAIGPGKNTPGNITLTLTAGITVVAATPSSVPPTTFSTTGTLPTTGSGDTRPLVAIGVGLAVVGGLLVLGTRRRRTA